MTDRAQCASADRTQLEARFPQGGSWPGSHSTCVCDVGANSPRERRLPRNSSIRRAEGKMKGPRADVSVRGPLLALELSNGKRNQGALGLVASSGAGGAPPAGGAGLAGAAGLSSPQPMIHVVQITTRPNRARSRTFVDMVLPFGRREARRGPGGRAGCPTLPPRPQLLAVQPRAVKVR
jgi:hypothetical protein